MVGNSATDVYARPLWPINWETMKNTITILILISSISAFGQNHFIGLKGGVNWTNVASSDFPRNSINRTGFSGGISYEFLLNESFVLGGDLLYQQRGFIIESEFTDNDGNPSGVSMTSTFNYDYLSIPIKAGYIVGKKISGFINLGIVSSLLIDAKTITSTVDSIVVGANYFKIIGETANVTDFVSKLDFAGLIEIGGNYNIGSKLSIFSAFVYQRSLTSITNSEYFAGNNIKHYGMTLSIGLKYALTNK